MKERIIENGIEYKLRGDIYYPILTVGEQTSYQIGNYGNMHLEFIEKHRKGRYNKQGGIRNGRLFCFTGQSGRL